MSELAKRLDDLWEIDESEREKGIKLLNKIFSNILSNPHDQKFRDLNFSKIRQKLEKCKPAFYMLYCAGFGQSPDGSRLQWQNTTVTMKLLQAANTGLQGKISGVDVDMGEEYGSVVMPSEQHGSNHQKKEKRKQEKLMQQQQPMDTDAPPPTTDDANAVDEEEMRQAMAMSMDQDDNGNTNAIDDEAANKIKDDNKDNNDVTDAGGDDADGNSVSNQLADAGLSQDELALMEQIKASKGITVTLKPDDLKGLSKAEKVEKFREVREQYRKEQAQNVVKQKLDKERQRRENIHKAQEAERKRKAYELRMASQRKDREKKEAERRKKAIREKIAVDKQRRLEQKAREQRKKEEAQAAAAQQQEPQ